jgi:hypothetical protein
MMLKNKKIIIAHGVQQRQDTVFLAYKTEFDKLSESDFVDFWCIYVVSLAYEQFIRNDRFKKLLAKCNDEINAFRKAYRDAGIPDFDHPKTLHQLLAWALNVPSSLPLEALLLRRLGTDGSQTCMGVFLSSGFLVCCRFLVWSGKAVPRRRLRSGSRSARKGVKGPKC